MSRAVVLDNDVGFQTSEKSWRIPDALELYNLHLQVMLEVNRKLNSRLDLDTLLQTILEVASHIIDARAASILLLDKTTGELHFEAATGVDLSALKQVAVPVKGSIAGWIAVNNRPQVVNSAHQDPRHYEQVDQETKFHTRSVLGVPVRIKEETIGVLEVMNKRDDSPFTAQDIETLEVLADQAAAAIENARLYRDLRDQMQTLQDTQARLVQREKLAAIGELAAGVAHELNNPLTSILGFAELLLLKDFDAQSQQDLDRIINQTERASKIVSSLLDFSRQYSPERKPVYIHDIIRSALDLLAYELRSHGVRIDLKLASSSPSIMADHHQVQQIFINLIQNACQAIGDASDPCVTINTEIRQPTFSQARRDRYTPNLDNRSVIAIRVQDNGQGIPASQLPRIFDPFFTTKEPGKGTGLGLSICHTIVSKHEGHIWAESDTGQGTTMVVELPIIAPELSSLIHVTH